MALMRRLQAAQAAPTAAALGTAKTTESAFTRLQVSTAPWPGDVVHAQPTAPLGHVDVQLGLGRGTRGKGQRIGDDAALCVACLRRLAEHITAYADDYEQAAREDGTTDGEQPDTAGTGWAAEMATLQSEHEPF